VTFKIEGSYLVKGHAVARTAASVVGYVECVIGGRDVRFVGRYDNPYSAAAVESGQCDCGELVWIDNVFQECEPGGEPTFLPFDPNDPDSDGITTESIMSSLVDNKNISAVASGEWLQAGGEAR
jgi:hypothetical protein